MSLFDLVSLNSVCCDRLNSASVSIGIACVQTELEYSFLLVRAGGSLLTKKDVKP